MVCFVMENFEELYKRNKEFFALHRDKFVEHAYGKWVVICGCCEMSFHDSFSNAVRGAREDHGLQPGQYIIKHCIPEDEEEVCTIYSPRT